MLMNIAKIMIPRACTVFLNEKQTVRRDFCPPISIDADEGEVVRAALNQNFVSIVNS